MYSQAFGQPSYRSQPYPPPPVNTYYGQPQFNPYAPHPPASGSQLAPPPVYHFDPNTFRRDYMKSLEELVVNSRSVIQHLSSLAQEFSRYADIVVSCIEMHIRKVPPSLKLHGWYLIDAISKNFSDTYARRFASIVTPLFLDTYAQVDDEAIRQKMLEMLMTWRRGSPTGNEVFGAVNQIAIERGAWSQSTIKMRVLAELQFAIDVKNKELQANPNNNDAENKLNIFTQLRKVVNSGVPQEELGQILLTILQAMSGQTPPVPPAVPRAPLPSAWSPPAYPPSRPLPPQHPPTLYPNSSNPFPSNSYPIVPPAAPVPPQVPTPTIDSAKLSSILNSLASYLPSSGIATPPLAVAPEPKVAPPTQESSAQDASWRNYRQSILSQRSRLSSTEILKTKPDIKGLMYDHLPSQCKQCGLRFSGSPSGRQQLQEHLDLHFKHNRQASKGVGRGNSRNPFWTAEEWIRNEQGSDESSTLINATVSGSPIQTEAELRSSFVVVPPGDEAKRISCPICKEHLKTEFLEDDEEWVWRNAVAKDDKIYHATCRAEAMASTSLASRLRNDLVSSSRGGTPEGFLSSRSTPPLGVRKSPSPPTPDSKTGTKRKVEDLDDPQLTGTPSGTPPSKKLVI